MKILFFIVIFMVVCGAGCSDSTEFTASEALSVGEFYTSFVVVDDGEDQIYAEAQLTKDEPPNVSGDDTIYIDLGGNDALWLSNGSESLQELNFGSDLFEQTGAQSDKHQPFVSANNVRDRVYFLFIWGYVIERGTFYSATYSRPSDEENEYTVTLVRSRNVGQFKSTVTMPNAFDIASPSNNASFDRSEDDIEIIWTDISGSDTQIQITASTTCVDGSFDEFTDLVSTDTGSYTFTAGVLDSEVLSGTCSSSITVSKVIIGELNPAFAGGLIQGQQVRRLTLSLTD